jgi:hypothetical protein
MQKSQAINLKPIVKLSDVDSKEVKHIVKFRIAYTKGGINYFDFSKVEMGYHLHIQPCKREYSEHGYSDSFMGDSGMRLFLEGGSRFSQKTLEKLAHSVGVAQIIPVLEKLGVKFEEYTEYSK